MQNSIDIFISNMELLLEARQLSNRELAKKSGVSDRLIGMYRNRESAPSIEKAEKIARALGFQLWQMQIPNFQIPLSKDNGFNDVLYAYSGADDDGRKMIEQTARYIDSRTKPPGNDLENDKKKTANG